MADELMLPPNFSAIGLTFPKSMTFDEWSAYGPLLEQIAVSGPWWYGDWINEGERRYGENTPRRLEVSELSYATLRQYAWVSRQVDASSRLDSLSFSHHQEVAKLPEKLQAKFLDSASKDRWSVRQLRAAVKNHQTIEVEQPTKEDVSESEGKTVAEVPLLTSAEEIREKSPTPPSDVPGSVLAKQLNRPYGELVRGIDKLADAAGGKGENWEAANAILNELHELINCMAGGQG